MKRSHWPFPFALALIPLICLGVLLSPGAHGNPRPPRAFRIALISDPHVTRGTEEDQALYGARFAKVIAAVNASGADLALIAGDLTQSGKPDEVADFREQIRGFKLPVRYVFGNHDVGAKRIAGKTGGTTAERVARLEAALGPSFFVDIQGGGAVRIIGVNGSLFGSGLPREADQWAFLERELTAPSGDDARVPTLLLSHYPLFLESADEVGGDYWNVEVEPRARLLKLLKRGGVSVVLSGHLHRPLRKVWEGIPCIGTHPVSFGLPRGKQRQGWTLISITPEGKVSAEEQFIEDSPPDPGAD